MTDFNLDFRIESIGGMGANLAGKILGELGAVCLNLNASNFSSYGSEKTGSPVTAFIRWRTDTDTLIENTPVELPDILALFHHSLLNTPACLAGLTQKSVLIVNSFHKPDELREKYHLKCQNITCIDCQTLMRQHKTRLNMLMLGAVLAVLSDEKLYSGAQTLLEKMFSEKGEDVAKNNLHALKLGYENISSSLIQTNADEVLFAPMRQISSIGYENAPIGGILPSRGSTAQNNLSLSRSGYMPKYLIEKCINCGLCDTTCPDMVFTFKEGEYLGKRAMINQGPDYRYCKGCLRCVEICPTQALVAVEEKVSSEISSHGADPIITSEAYLSENVKEGALNE